MRLNPSGLSYQEVLAELTACYDQDQHFQDGRIMGSMCTSPDALAKEAYMLFIEANLGNPGLCPGTLDIEQKVIEMLLGLLGMAPEGVGTGQAEEMANAGGQLVSGGTEANITALWLARNSTGKREMIIPESGHFSLFKAADLLCMEPKVAKLTTEFRMDVDHMKELITARTAVIVGIAGTTELGQVDPIEEIGEVAIDAGIPFHVDAAFGGFVLPFLEDFTWIYDFRSPGVTSIGVDPHKMGLATVPSGALLLRDRNVLESIQVRTPYLTSERNMSLAGTRNSASVAATYAVMRHLGYQGYKHVIDQCMETTRYLAKKLRSIGIEPAIEPIMNVVAARLRDPGMVVKAMRRKGWHLSAATHPPSIRFIIMPHITRSHVDAMLVDLEEILE